MTWADIKFGSDDGEGFLINIREGKTQKSLLPVESLPELREILKAHFAKQVDAGHSVFPSPPVFVTATGQTDVEIGRFATRLLRSPTRSMPGSLAALRSKLTLSGRSSRWPVDAHRRSDKSDKHV